MITGAVLLVRAGFAGRRCPGRCCGTGGSAADLEQSMARPCDYGQSSPVFNEVRP